MKRFLNRYADRIVGVIEGFDRLLFRGVLLSISNGKKFRDTDLALLAA